MIFNKPSLSIADQRSKLASRGLNIPDIARAERYLATIGYYRLSAYTYPFQNDHNTHAFHQKVTFDDVLNLYIFDRRLRLALLDALERVEVAVRTRINDVMCARTGNAHWHLELKNFKPEFDHVRFLAEIGKHDDTNVQVYRGKYTLPPEPPSWIAFQTLSFGTCSVTLSNLHKREKNLVCQSFGIAAYPMTRWLHAMTVLRNTAAHHSRTWDRTFIVNLPISAPAPKTMLAPIDNTNDNILDGYALVLEMFMQHVSPGSHWWSRVCQLIQNYYDATPHGFHKASLLHRARHLVKP